MDALYWVSSFFFCLEVSSLALGQWFTFATTERFEPCFPEPHCFTGFRKLSSHRAACMAAIGFLLSAAVSAHKLKTKEHVSRDAEGWK